MGRAEVAGGPVLFDQKPVLPSGISIGALWQSGQRFNALSPTKDMRYSEQGNLLVRKLVAGEKFDTLPSGVLTPEDIITTGRLHLRKLQSFGMCVVSSLMECRVGDDPLEFPRDNHRIIAYGASPYIASMHKLDSPEAEPHVTQRKIKEFITDPLSEYLNWCAKEYPTFFLSDVYTADQYGWDSDSGVLFLHDFDPVLYANNSDSRTRSIEDMHLIGI
jgi:hypothetical protein